MLIAGNWKMNTDVFEAQRLARDVVDAAGAMAASVKVAVCPPSVSLQVVSDELAGSEVLLGAQNMHQESAGAYTGEVSAAMLRSVGCRFVILGHSERRLYFGETDELVNAKVKQAMRNGLIPIVCVGETLEERDRGEEEAVVLRQVQGAFSDVVVEDGSLAVIAYEPVWAIGTGRTASPDQAQSMHAFIRGLLAERFGTSVASSMHILYGGSMKPSNAPDLLGRPDIDGGLIGGASLKAEDFVALVKSAAEVMGS